MVSYKHDHFEASLHSAWCNPILRMPMNVAVGWALGNSIRMNRNLSKAKDSDCPEISRVGTSVSSVGHLTAIRLKIHAEPPPRCLCLSPSP